MHSCRLCRKSIPDFSIHSIDRAGHKFHVDCAKTLMTIFTRRRKRHRKTKETVS